jgi:hypothetical protein
MLNFFRGQTLSSLTVFNMSSISAGEQVHDLSSTKEDLPAILFRVYCFGPGKLHTLRFHKSSPRMDLAMARSERGNDSTQGVDDTLRIALTLDQNEEEC